MADHRTNPRRSVSPALAKPLGAILGGFTALKAVAIGIKEGVVGRTRRRAAPPAPPTGFPGDRERGETPPASEKEGGGWASLKPRTLWPLLKEAGSEWVDDKCSRIGAALAYYTVFSIAPLLVITIAVAGLVFGHEAAAGYLSEQIQFLVGPQGAEAIEAMVANANKPSTGIFATLVSVIILLVAATNLFAELQDALNTVWEIEPKPGRGVWGTIKDRLLSFTMVMGMAFLLLVSLVVSAALSALAGLFGEWATSAAGQVVDVLVSFGVITVLFAMIYRFLPDVKIAWRDVWLGAAVTSLLFTAGKFLIGLYLGHSAVASSYGAAGSLVVLLIWVYYSAQIFLFGAELTKAYADKYGSRIVPKEGARPVTAEARAQQGLATS